MKKIWMKALMALMIFSSTLPLAGCDIQIFEKKKDPYVMVEYKKDELEDGNYYVKDGTSFYQLYKKDGTASGVSQEASNSRLLWFVKDKSLVPTYYGNELIAFPTLETGLYDSVVERFADGGYSIGVHGAVYSDEGIVFDAKQQCVEGSSLAKQLSGVGSENIKIVKINGVQVTSQQVDNTGTIAGLQQDATYKIGFYSGSKYYEKDVIADVWFLKSFEVFRLDKAEPTPNGYLALMFPEDYKSGYYMVNGYGVCRYYNVPKSEAAGVTEMNEPYYTSSSEQMAVFSQQYVKDIPYLSNNVTFEITYDRKSLLEGQEAKAYLTNPQGERYNFLDKGRKSDDGELYITLKKATPGKWTINIFPRDIAVLDVVMESDESSAENKQEVYEIAFDEAQTNTIFYVDYEGEGVVSAIMVDKSGETFEFENNKETGDLEYNASYIDAGIYTIYVYHKTDTRILDVSWREDEAQYETDVITIEE